MATPINISRDAARAQLELIDNTLIAYGIPIEKKVKKFRLPFEAITLELFLTQWAKATDSAVKKALKVLDIGSGDVSDREAQAILKKAQTEVNSIFPDGVGKKLPLLMEKSYKKGRNPILRSHGMRIDWEKPDIEAVDWLTDHHLYWVGEYYDKHVSEVLANVIKADMQNGLSRKDIGESLKEFFDGYPGVPNRPESYWRGMAANGMNRSRNFGLIQGYEEVNITTLVVMAVMDERTSDICREMNGREIPVAKAAKQRDKMMEAKDPEDIKEIAPWPTLDFIQGKSTTTILNAGIAMPPYHWHCRTTVVEK